MIASLWAEISNRVLPNGEQGCFPGDSDETGEAEPVDGIDNKVYNMINPLHNFLRSRQLLSCSRIPQHIIELEYLLPCWQERSTGLYPEPDKPNTHYPIIFF
jgi:hypothetical protein